jgi:hypothetical protein
LAFRKLWIKIYVELEESDQYFREVLSLKRYLAKANIGTASKKRFVKFMSLVTKLINYKPIDTKLAEDSNILDWDWLVKIELRNREQLPNLYKEESKI